MFRILVTEQLRLHGHGQFLDVSMIDPEIEEDPRTGSEIAAEVITKLGLVVV